MVIKDGIGTSPTHNSTEVEFEMIMQSTGGFELRFYI